METEEKLTAKQQVEDILDGVIEDGGESIFTAGCAIYKIAERDGQYSVEMCDAETSKHFKSGNTDWTRKDMGNREEATEFLMGLFGEAPMPEKGRDGYEHSLTFKPDAILADTIGAYHSEDTPAEIVVWYKSGPTLTLDENTRATREIFVGTGERFGLMKDFEKLDGGKFTPQQIDSINRFVNAQERDVVKEYPHMGWPRHTDYLLEFKNGMTLFVEADMMLKACDRANNGKLNITTGNDPFNRPISITMKLDDLSAVIDASNEKVIYQTPERAESRKVAQYPQSQDRGR